MDSISDAVIVTLMQINQNNQQNRISEWTTGKGEKTAKRITWTRKKLEIEQFEKEEKLRLEKIEQKERQPNKDLTHKKLEMEQKIERMKKN